MSQTIDPDLLSQTAQLLSECPKWCTAEHDINEHPEDIRHGATAAQSPWGPIDVYVYPVPLGDSPSATIYVPEDNSGGDMTPAQALAMANALVQAAVLYAEVTK